MRKVLFLNMSKQASLTSFFARSKQPSLMQSPLCPQERVQGRGVAGSSASRLDALTAEGVNHLLSTLNPEQRCAVEHGDGLISVQAGPGSGKTRVIVSRVLFLIHIRHVRNTGVHWTLGTGNCDGNVVGEACPTQVAASAETKPLAQPKMPL